jgi:hypothetical protein
MDKLSEPREVDVRFGVVILPPYPLPPPTLPPFSPSKIKSRPSHPHPKLIFKFLSLKASKSMYVGTSFNNVSSAAHQISILSEDAGTEPRTVAEFSLTARPVYHYSMYT